MSVIKDRIGPVLVPRSKIAADIDLSGLSIGLNGGDQIALSHSGTLEKPVQGVRPGNVAGGGGDFCEAVSASLRIGQLPESGVVGSV